MVLYTLCLLFLFQTCFAIDESYFTRYRGYTIAKVSIQNENELKELEKYMLDDPKMTILSSNKAKKWVNVLVPSEAKLNFQKNLKSSRMSSVLTFEDLETLIRKEYETSRAKAGEPFNYEKYHTLEEIHNWIDDLVKTYPEWVESFVVAKSYEDREMKALKISIGTSPKPKPAIWIEAAMHSREWIGPATVILMAHRLLTRYKYDSDITTILNTFDFYVLPVTNPDGYVYTHTTDRLWRKTRSLNPGSACVGVDPNRNWDCEWCTTGASNDTCSFAYCGSKPFSEVEIKGLADFVAKHKDTIVSFMDFHSYGQFWMHPFAFSNDVPKDYDEMEKASKVAVDALESLYGTKYVYGSAAGVLYEASGSGADWTYVKHGILYSFGIELGSDDDEIGHEIPADQIKKTGYETLEAVKALALHIKKQMKLPSYNNAINVTPSLFMLLAAITSSLLIRFF